MKIYTRKGDSGFTRRSDGKTVPKHDPLISVSGDFDSLNAAIGLSVSFLRAYTRSEETEIIARELIAIQSMLFDAGAVVTGYRKKDFWNQDASVEFLENRIDYYTEKLPPLRNFILPGGHIAAAALHTARCECRRLERNMMAAEKSESLMFINRLSDYLFTAARAVNFYTQTPELLYGESK